MTTIEQHLEDYEAKLLDLVHSMIRGNSPKALEAKELKLKAARKQLADHITLCQMAHSHAQYELRTEGLP